MRSNAPDGTARIVTVICTYRGRQVTASEAAFIRELIAKHPDASRRALSKQLCEAWNWVQPNGALRDMVCRGLMLELHRSGHIELPPVKASPHNPLAKRPTPAASNVEMQPIQATVAELLPLTIRQVRRTSDEPAFNSLLQSYHYLAYTQPVGEHLKYLVSTQGRPIACFTWSSAPRHLGPRDRFIGWTMAQRKRNIRFIAYNSRFLILPWVNVRHLASHLLSQMAKRISRDWEALYHHPIYFLETFIDPTRFAGTCYRAANWQHLGSTTGRGKDDLTHRQNRTIKEIWGYPLTKRFRAQLSEGA